MSCTHQREVSRYVEEDVFNQLVLDEWTWKNNFVATGALYKTF